MMKQTTPKARVPRFAPRRKAISVSPTDLVHSEPLGDKDLPLLVRPAGEEIRLADWARGNRENVERDLRQYGGLLFRGFGLSSIEDFEAAVQALSGDLLEYRERSSPRHAVAGKVYTSTDYPPDQPIYLHNENSYQQVWPMHIFFFCHIEPEKGGETPLADVRKVYRRIDPRIRDRFMEKRWCYVRNFGDGFGLPWQTVFQTDDKSLVEAYCKKNGIVCEWRAGDRLRTRAVRPAAVAHPESGEMVWFNHATFFHFSTLPDPVRKSLLEEFDEDDLPANSYYGDGSPIEQDVLAELRAHYDAETVAFPWRRGDLLMLDNMTVAHGRAPFEGARKILVAMTQPCSWDQLDAREQRPSRG